MKNTYIKKLLEYSWTLSSLENITINSVSLNAARDINMDGAVNLLDLTLVTQQFC